jgi:hypothetical protein
VTCGGVTPASVCAVMVYNTCFCCPVIYPHITPSLSGWWAAAPPAATRPMQQRTQRGAAAGACAVAA